MKIDYKGIPGSTVWLRPFPGDWAELYRQAIEVMDASSARGIELPDDLITRAMDAGAILRSKGYLR
jgi:hypothetical protein